MELFARLNDFRRTSLGCNRKNYWINTSAVLLTTQDIVNEYVVPIQFDGRFYYISQKTADLLEQNLTQSNPVTLVSGSYKPVIVKEV